MKRVSIDFYSYRPRLVVGLIRTTDHIPIVGDEIIIDKKFISQLDKKYFPKYMRNSRMTFRIKKRTWNLEEKKCALRNWDVELELDWTQEESVKVEKYLEKSKKELEHKKEKE